MQVRREVSKLSFVVAAFPVSRNEATDSVWLGTNWLCWYFLQYCVDAVQHVSLSFPVSNAAEMLPDLMW